jgi:osmoprotectant transport system ATP-binding protein
MEVPEGEICVLLGPSGCGKTTTMKMVNRLVEPSSGTIFIGDKDTNDYNPVELRRTLGYVIQQIGLFPNKTIEDNICIVPDILGWDRAKSRARAEELLEMVALDPKIFLKRYPKELSGGQQQRIGVLRAIAADPPVLLMDEPFGAIDPINRAIIQDEFLKMQAKMKKTIMFVSHDIDEAVKMADRIAIFSEGRLVQYDTPDNILAHPKNRFVSDFVGSDRTLKRLQLLSVTDAMMHDPPCVRSDDTLATAAALTVRGVVDAMRRFLPADAVTEVLLTGGGARNRAMSDALADALGEVPVRAIDELGIPAEAKEAVDFAFLAREALLGRNNVIRSVTGASRALILGTIARG